MHLPTTLFTAYPTDQGMIHLITTKVLLPLSHKVDNLLQTLSATATAKWLHHNPNIGN